MREQRRSCRRVGARERSPRAGGGAPRVLAEGAGPGSPRGQAPCSGEQLLQAKAAAGVAVETRLRRWRSVGTAVTIRSAWTLDISGH